MGIFRQFYLHTEWFYLKYKLKSEILNQKLFISTSQAKGLKYSDLTKEDIALARDGWDRNIPEDKYSEVSAAIFRELFNRHPDYEKFFSHLKDVPHEDLFTSPRFSRHMSQVLTPSLKKMLDNLEDYSELEKMMMRIGEYHIKLKLLPSPENVKVLQGVIIDTMKKAFGDNFPQKSCEALDKAFTVSFAIFVKGMEKKR